MKKFLLGFLAGAIIVLPVGAYAWGTQEAPHPKPIYRFNDDDNEVSVFDDRDNKCYLSYDRWGTQSSISCVKK